MKKTMLIRFGVILLLAGVGYSTFWATSRRDFRALAAAEAPGPRTADEFPARQRLAMEIIGVDLFTPSATSPGGPAELARMISRRIHTHLGAGVLSAILGLVLLAKGIATPRQGSQQAPAR